MKKQVSVRNIPIGILFIAVFYVFGAFVLLASILINPVGASQAIAKAHGLSLVMGVEILVIVGALALVLAYGLVCLAPWGFFLAIAYLLYLAGVSLVMGGLSFLWTGQAETQIYFGNLLWSALVMVYLFHVRRWFFSPAPAEAGGEEVAHESV